MLKDFRAYQFSLQFYRVAERARCPIHLRDQLLRAASSIPLNLAEGTGRMGQRDRGRFFQIAYGSLRECQSILEIAGHLQESEEVKMADQLGAQLYRLIKSTRPKTET